MKNKKKHFFYLILIIAFLLIIDSFLIITLDITNKQSKNIDTNERSTNKKILKEYEKKPQIAIVIDDFGYNLALARQFLDLNFAFTASLLPNLPFTNQIAQIAKQKGKEIILHLPMEPHNRKKKALEKETLLVSMNKSQIINLIDKDLKSVAYALGVNNHQGSKMIEDEEKMEIILTELKKRNLFFLDSRTSPKSIINKIANNISLQIVQRDVFLDGEKNLPYIYKQLDELAAVAKENGKAVGIGHIHPNMVKALRIYGPKFINNNFELIPVSKVLH